MNKAKVVLALALGLALYAAATAGPASAVPSRQRYVRSRVSVAFRRRDRRGCLSGAGAHFESPNLGQAADNLPASAKGKGGPKFKATVPVYFHVVTDGTIGALPTRRSTYRSTCYNTFAGGEGGANSGFKFQLVGVTRTDNADWFYAGPRRTPSTP